mmetsp:Transcript_13747/g.22694  ORF Transcript_13747/g.22694 Transcript_13747/m.22694 type:complete len:396 (+) Transcript_13747:185-1372(+)
MIDRRGIARRTCRACDCLEYEVPRGGGHDCSYCGHKPTDHLAHLENPSSGQRKPVPEGLADENLEIEIPPNQNSAFHSPSNLRDHLTANSIASSLAPSPATRRLPKVIYLVRHGQSEANLDYSILEKKADHRIELTDSGRQQALDVGHTLRERIGDQPIMFYVSPYLRAVQTYEGIITQFDNDKCRLFLEPRLREQDFGNFQDPREMARAKLERKAHSNFYFRFPNGESGADVYDRVSTLLETLFRDFNKPGFPSVVVIVSHGLLMRLFLMRWYHWTVEFFESTENPGNCDLYLMSRKSDSNKFHLDIGPRTNSSTPMHSPSSLRPDTPTDLVQRMRSGRLLYAQFARVNRSDDGSGTGTSSVMQMSYNEVPTSSHMIPSRSPSCPLFVGSREDN